MFNYFRPEYPRMRQGSLLLVQVLLVAAFLYAPSAIAQNDSRSSALDRVQSIFEGIARGFQYFGQKTEEILGTERSIHGGVAEFHEERSFNQRFPVSGAPKISISNEFGVIRVSTWEQRVIEVNAKIRVGAESPEIAVLIADDISVTVADNDEIVAIHTDRPDAPSDVGLFTVTVDYHIRVPANVDVAADNFFGDTYILGVSGPVTVNARYGAVELQELAGPVALRTYGEFPVRVSRLGQGGSFQMHGAQAEFSHLTGRHQISNFRGSTQIRELNNEVELDVSSESGPVHIHLNNGNIPDFSVSLLYGALNTVLPYQGVSRGNRLTARHHNEDAQQQLHVSGSFSEVYIQVEGQETSPQVQADQDGNKPFNDVLTRQLEVVEGARLVVAAEVGDVRVEGIDENVVRITANRIVWTPTAAQAPSALDALRLETHQELDRLNITTEITEAMQGFDVGSYRVDLFIQAPRTMPVSIQADNGVTYVNGLGNDLEVSQRQGAIRVEHCKATLNLNNQNGDIHVAHSGGPLEAMARYGVINLTNIFDAITVRGIQSRTIIESPQSDVYVRNSGGDVRILAMEGIGGAYDVLADGGSLSMLLGYGADVTLHAITQNGKVDSAYPLTGTIERNRQELQGRLRDGLHELRLEARNGDIILD